MSCQETQPKTAGECDRCSPARRNRYFRDKRLTVADYQLEQTHLIERRRLINRAMLGWGIVQGFEIEGGEGWLTVGTGVALDRCGREVVACETVRLAAADDVLWLSRGDCGLEAGDPPQVPQQQGNTKRGQTGGELGHYLLSAHYAEQPIDGIRVDDGCGAAKCEANHLCETVVYSLIPFEHCPPGLAHCLGNPWAYQPCRTHDKGWEPAPYPPDARSRVAATHDRGTQEQLVDWSLERLSGADFCKPCPLECVGKFHVDLDSGVPLACVAIAYDCGEIRIGGLLNDWWPKRLARPNDVLFDLIRGCDLVRIQDVGWREWLEPAHRRIPFTEFAKKFERPQRPADAPKTKRGWHHRMPADTRFWVCLSGPVQVSSLTPDVFTITLIQRDLNESVGNVVRVPVIAIAAAPTTEGDPPGTTRAFRPMVSARFWEGEINPDNASGFETETLVEFEVRTGFIVDSLGQEVAGGGRYVPTSGCVPGGRFLSSFVVLPEEEGGDEGSQQAALPPAQEA